MIKRIAVGSNPFLQNGNWLVGCGDAHKYVIVDPVNEIVKETVSTDDLSKVSLLFVVEPHQYRNGHVLLANWNGHSSDKNQPKVIELDENKNVVWTLEQTDPGINVSTVFSFREK